jgi:hypothetical protein
MNEEMSLKDTLSRISHEMEGKIDSDSLQLMKDYFGESCDSVERTAQFHLLESWKSDNFSFLLQRNKSKTFKNHATRSRERHAWTGQMLLASDVNFQYTITAFHVTVLWSCLSETRNPPFQKARVYHTEKQKFLLLLTK